VLTVMILASVDVPLTGMFAVIIAIDWFIDRFRTAINVTGDMYAARIMQKITGIKDEDASTVGEVFEPAQKTDERV
jgi:Na+/H+-dicarboxylate symporter